MTAVTGFGVGANPPAALPRPGIPGTIPPHGSPGIPGGPVAPAGGTPALAVATAGTTGVTVPATLVPVTVTVDVPETTLPVATASGVATMVATDVGTPTTTVAVPLATAIAGVVATTAVGVVVATACPDAPGAFPSPPTMVAMTSRAGTANLNRLRVGRAISSSFGTTLWERIDCE